MELEVYNIKGEKTDRKVTLNDEIFNVTPNDHALYLDAKQYQANQRQGTHSTLERSTISGSTRKLKRQKGTGTARSGSIKSPLFRGGARIFGPHPRDYSFKLNKKLRKVARRSAIAYKLQTNNFLVLEDFTLEAPKTKQMLEIISNFKLEGKKVMFVVPAPNGNLYLSARNLQDVNIMLASNLNTYDILNANVILFMESAIDKAEQVLV